jgi:hypothetical protein
MPVAPEEITRLLTTTETLLWHGRPRQGIVFRSFDKVFIPIGLVSWGIIAYFWVQPFVLINNFYSEIIYISLIFIYVAIGRMLVEVWQRARVYYAVTSERIIIVAGLFPRRTTFFKLRTMDKPVILETKNGENAISLDGGMPFAGFAGVAVRISLPFWDGIFHRQFILIPEAKSVYELILKARRDAANG